MAMYWVRVIATNDGGEGQSQELDNYILAMPPPGKKIHVTSYLCQTVIFNIVIVSLTYWIKKYTQLCLLVSGYLTDKQYITAFTTTLCHVTQIENW